MVSKGNGTRRTRKAIWGSILIECVTLPAALLLLSLLSALSTICRLAPFTLAAYRETDGVLVITPAVWSALSSIVHRTMANQGLQKEGKMCMKEGRRKGLNSDHMQLWGQNTFECDRGTKHSFARLAEDRLNQPSSWHPSRALIYPVKNLLTCVFARRYPIHNLQDIEETLLASCS